MGERLSTTRGEQQRVANQQRIEPWPDDVPVNGRNAQDLPPRVHLGLGEDEEQRALVDLRATLGHALPEAGKKGLATVLRDYASKKEKGSMIQERDACVRAAAWFLREAVRVDRVRLAKRADTE
jgi:hypothetical protein